ncbi:MAG: M20/M25/M40 family metallo-hydrolase [Candidatus Omnitrophota bacterium]
MRKFLLTVFLMACFFLFIFFIDAEDHHSFISFIHHDLNVFLDPAHSSIRVTDTVTLPPSLHRGKEDKISFVLHGNLAIVSFSQNIEIVTDTHPLKKRNEMKNENQTGVPLSHYLIIRKAAQPGAPESLTSFTITYDGQIHHPIRQMGGEYARGFSETPGIIGPDGVYLAGSSYWVPRFSDTWKDQPVTFTLQTTVPENWSVVSQGKETQTGTSPTPPTVWTCTDPMDEIYLIAAPFQTYGIKTGNVDIRAFLRTPDDNLANKYMETTGQYLEMYEKLIGPYPYSKFALVENFWETGYGMPSFTLLGPKIIRFPFILHSSYPHELLHNWWGNSVFVDQSSGNWCEGLTTYLADHLIKEDRGEGEDYRKTVLQEYTHYVSGKKGEFALSQFKDRTDSLSSAIGYGKSLMVVHMLRQMVGDTPFKDTIRHFYKNNPFKHASFSDFQHSVETVTQKSFNDFFNQWLNRTGAPAIRLTHAQVIEKTNGQDSPSHYTFYTLRFSLEQVQQQDPYRVQIPVAVSLDGRKDAVIKIIDMSKRKQDYELSFPQDQRPVRIDVDPQFDVFRELHGNEIPPTLSNAFGAKNVWIILPSQESGECLTAYKTLAQQWAKESECNIEIKMDNQLSSLPTDRPVWVLGWKNKYNPALSNGPGSAYIDKLPDHEKASIVMAVKNPRNPEHVIVLVSADRMAALPGLGRKLPHYGKYSYLAFEGDEPVNSVKGQWAPEHSPMSASLVSSSQPIEHGTLPKREPLARLAPLFSSKRMMDHVQYLTSDALEGRGLGSPGIDKAAQYIADAFKTAGLKPGGDNGSYFQTWQTTGGSENKPITLRNVIGVIPGTKPEWANQSVILCAHDDHLGRGWPDVHAGDEGKIHPGADDNASGVSVMLELAKILGTLKPERTIVFIAFTGEESHRQGSSYFVQNLEEKDKDRLTDIMGVVNLDTVGRLTAPNKLMVIGESTAREWKFIFMGVGYTTGIQTELVKQELDSGDHVSFIQKGIPGIQLTSGPNADYHRPSDTADKIDANGLVQVAAVTREVILYLCERAEPLTHTINGESTPKPAESTAVRKVGTGMMPDFSYEGKGFRVGMVSPGSPAEKAGLQKGDVIIKIANTEIANVREYSDVLKTLKPGDTVPFVYKRDEKELTVSITLVAR